MSSPESTGSGPKKTNAWLWLPVLSVVVLATLWHAREPANSDAIKAIDGMKASIDHLAEQKKFGAEVAPMELQAVTTSAKGDMGVIELLTKQFLNDASAQFNDYLKALEGAGWTNILAAERLKKDPTLQESRAILEASTVIVKEYRQKAVVLLDSLPERARQAPFESEEMRNGFLKGLASTTEANRKHNEQNWNYEEAIVAEFGAVIELLARSQGHYQFDEDGSVVFDTDEALETYNRHIAKANELIEAQAEAMKKQQAAASRKIDKVRDDLVGR